MGTYPVLDGGVTSQWPIRKATFVANLIERTASGRLWIRHRAEGSRAEWLLSYRGLSQEEAQRLEQFFQDQGGALQSFTFVDPTANLLVDSEDLSTAGWSKPGTLSISELAQETGRGRQWQVTNYGALAELDQSVLVPEGAHVCFSVELRSAAAAGIEVIAGDQARACEAVAVWQRLHVSVQADAGPVRAGIRLQAGHATEVREPQFELQLAPSGYRVSFPPYGVYPETKFANDRLELRASGPDRYETEVRLISAIPR